MSADSRAPLAIPLRDARSEGYRYEHCPPADATCVLIATPGPIAYRLLPCDRSSGWEWNRDVWSPTLSPSILATDGESGDESSLRCHLFVRDGRAQFLSDSTHKYSGKTVDLLAIDDIPFWLYVEPWGDERPEWLVDP